MRVRAATPDDRLDAVRVLDGALLDVSDVGAAIERGDALVACVDGPGEDGANAERVVGVIVLEPHEDEVHKDEVDEDRAQKDRSNEGQSNEGRSNVDRSNEDRTDSSGAGAHVSAVAVNRSRRHRGVGSALVEAARDRYGRLTADFRAEVRPFWDELGFEVEERDERLWGELA